MDVKLSHILFRAFALGLLSATLAADTRMISVKHRLYVGASEKMGNSSSKKLVNEQIVVIAPIESVKSTGERDNGLNVIAPEEIGQLSDTMEIDFYPETADMIGEDNEPSVSGLNLGVPGDLESSDLFEGDIIHTPGQAKDWNTHKAVMFAWNLWPRKSGIPTVFYTIGNTKVPTSTIQDAIAHYEEHTCIRFNKTVRVFPTCHQIVFKDGDSCSSMIGRQLLSFFVGQDVTLARNCSKGNLSLPPLPTVVHEIGHAAGLYHEKSRSDRDAYVKVIPDNIMTGKTSDFNMGFTRNYETTYDYSSVMQYGPLKRLKRVAGLFLNSSTSRLVFSSNGETTLSETDPMAQGLMIRSRTGLSFMDKLILNRMYGCVDKWVSQCSGISSDPCENMGYLGPDCNCVCPAGTSGTNCQTKTMSYTDALIKELLPLNERVTTPGTISSPSYPTPQLPLTTFTKIITASTCHVVELTVIGFTMFQRDFRKSCSSEGVEIRRDDPVTSGKWYCGSELKAGDTIQSEGRTMVLFYNKDKMTSNGNAGFSFDVTFKPEPSCR